MKYRDYLFVSTLLLLIFISCNTDSNESNGDKHFKPVPFQNVEYFLFVGTKSETPSLYKYDLKQNKHKPFWHKPRETVIDLSVSPDFMKAFFITALTIEEGGALPLIRKVKLYLVDLKSSEVKHIMNYGNTGQIITKWEDENNYKIVLNTIDKIIATDINQTTQLFNSFGKLLIDESKTFELLKDGYPQPSKAKVNYESPSMRYSIQESGERIAYYLNDKKTKQQDTLNSQPFFTNQFAWSYDDKFVAANFYDVNLNNPDSTKMIIDSSSIIIYSLADKKIQREWKGNGLKNFTLLNHLLIFDNGFGKQAELVIYNINTDKVINNIIISGGCGLKNIPGLSTFKVNDR